MTNQVYFETPRLVVRRWTMDDATGMVEGMNSPRVSKGFKTVYPYKESDAITYIKKTIDNDAVDSIYFAIVDKGTGELIGGGGIYNKRQKTSVGVWICEKKQRHGYAKEVVKDAIQYALDELGCESVYAYCYSWNSASLKIIKDLGFLIENVADDEEGTKVCGIIYKENDCHVSD